MYLSPWASVIFLPSVMGLGLDTSVVLMCQVNAFRFGVDWCSNHLPPVVAMIKSR